MGDTHPEGVDRGVGTSNPMPVDELASLMSKMMAYFRKELIASQVSWNATQTSINEKIVALKKARASRSVTPNGDHIHRNTSGGECVARGDGGYGEHVGNGNGRNGDGRYGDYKCYGGYSRGRHDRGDYESRYHDDGLDRGSRRERISRLHEEPLRRRNGEYDRHKGYESTIEKDTLCRARRGSSSRHGDCGNTQSHIPPWKTDTSHPIVSPKSSFELLEEQYERVVRGRKEKLQDLKYEGLGYEAKIECKPFGVLPTLNPDLSPMEYKGPSTDTFHMKWKVEAKTCLVIIDGGSGANMVSERLVAKLSLRVVEHPNPYDLQWLEECGVWRVKTQAMVPLWIGTIECDILCDVVLMNVCHVLLGKPWEDDNHAAKNDVTHEYKYVLGRTRVKLKPLLPQEVVKAYEHLRKEREREGFRAKVSLKSQESVKKD